MVPLIAYVHGPLPPWRWRGNRGKDSKMTTDQQPTAPWVVQIWATVPRGKPITGEQWDLDSMFGPFNGEAEAQAFLDSSGCEGSTYLLNAPAGFVPPSEEDRLGSAINDPADVRKKNG
jgi:hypothetical protein